MNVRKVLAWLVAVPVGFFFLMVAIGVVTTWNDPPKAKETTARANEARQEQIALKPPSIRPGPEDIVVFPDSSIVCLTQVTLQQAVRSGLRGEETKVNALVAGPGNENAPCFMVSPTKRLKVLSASYLDDAAAPMGLLEIVGEGVITDKGTWALSVGANVVQQGKRR